MNDKLELRTEAEIICDNLKPSKREQAIIWLLSPVITFVTWGAILWVLSL